MASELRTFVHRLGQAGLSKFFDYLGIDPADLIDLGPNNRTRQALTKIYEDQFARSKAEAIAGEVLALCKKGDLAELALRVVCGECTELGAILESDRSAEERAWLIWRTDAKLLDRARNIAMSYHWRNGKYNSAFKVSEGGPFLADEDGAIERIVDVVRQIDGGRRVHPDLFSYSDPETSGRDDRKIGRVHHLAIYLEQPASFLMEFNNDGDEAVPIIRRSAKELSIVFNESSGRLDVSGAGLGGQKVLADIADVFCQEAMENAELAKVERQEFNFEFFNRLTPPALTPPTGFEKVIVTELRTRSVMDRSSRSTFRVGEKSDAYRRLKELGVGSRLKLELIAGVTLLFILMPKKRGETGRKVKMTLNWPAGVSFDNATIDEQRQLRGWLENQDFGPANSGSLL